MIFRLILEFLGYLFRILGRNQKYLLVNQFSSVQSLSHVWLFVTPWTAAHQASLSITNSWSLLKLISIESVMPSNHLIICHLLSSCLQSFPASGSFPVSQFFASGSQSIGALASASVLPMNIQGWFPLGLTGLISLLFKGLLRVFSSIALWKHQFFSLYGPAVTSVHDSWKNHGFDYIDLCWQWCLCFLICCLGWS